MSDAITLLIKKSKLRPQSFMLAVKNQAIVHISDANCRYDRYEKFL